MTPVFLKNIFIGVLLLVLNACSDNKSRQPIDNEQEVEVQDHESTDIPNVTSGNAPSEHSLSINGQKFLSSNRALFKGDIIYLAATKEAGRLTGDIVVVTAHSKEQSNWPKEFKTTTIAANTYRLTAVNANVDLFATYQLMSKDNKYSVVELGVDYSPISSRETY